MKLPPFVFTRAESLDHALELLAELGSDAKALAGGQSLIPLMAFRLAHPAHLVDVSDLSELRYVRPDQGELVVGGTTRSAELAPSTRSYDVLFSTASTSPSRPPRKTKARTEPVYFAGGRSVAKYAWKRSGMPAHVSSQPPVDWCRARNRSSAA